MEMHKDTPRLLTRIHDEKWKLEMFDHDFRENYLRKLIASKAERTQKAMNTIEASENAEPIKDRIDKGEDISREECGNEEVYLAYIAIKLAVFGVDGEFYLDIQSNCGNCEKYISMLKIDEDNKKLSAVEWLDEGVKNVQECKLVGVESINTKIKVKDNLLFTNFFKKDGELMFRDESINYLKGMIHVAEKNAEIDVLCGQTGNMSVYIYQKGNSLRILDSNIEYTLSNFEDMIEDVADANEVSKEEIRRLAEEDTKKLEELEDGEDVSWMLKRVNAAKGYLDWELKGSVSCEMWRFMATSTENMEARGLEIDHWTDNPVVVEMESGEYEMKHYYGVSENEEEEPLLISEINLL